MAAWRWQRWWWGILLVVSGVGLGVIPEGDGRTGTSGGMARATCPGECICTVPGYVVCVADPGDVMPPTPPKDTHTLLLQGYTSISTQYLAHLAHVRHLQISRGNPQVLEQLPSLPQLEVLDMSLSGVLTLSTADLGHHVPNINHLNMSYNRITTVGDGDLTSLGQLHVLDLRGNPLHEMHRRALHGLTHLQYLDLSASQVGTLHYTWLRDTPTLAMLNVSHARIMEVPRLNHPRLATLDLSHNFITYLPQGLVDHAPGLRELYLHHNQLQHVGLTSLTSAPLLHTLDLSHNQLVNIDEFVFSDLINLRHLDLSSNALLERVEHGAFTGLHNLEVLSLRNTSSLYEVEEVAFSGLPRLAMLDLRDSALSVLPLSLRLVTNHTVVLLAGTSLLCDCHHHWLPQLLTRTDISRWSGVEPLTCNDGHQRSPHQLAVHLSKLGCRSPVINGTPGVWLRTRGGDSALLECNVTGHPPANILWVSATHKVFRYNNISRSNDDWLSRTLLGIEAAAVSDDPGVEVLASGHLLIKDMMRADMGRYKCFAYNSVGNASIVKFLGMDDAPLRSLYTESLLLGFALAALFLLVTLIVQFINYLMDRMGWSCCWSCCCCKDRLSPKARQIRKLLETVESYKTQQLERLRENYNAQVTTIKDSCYQQMERIRESYSGQTKNLKDLRDYSTQGLTTVKDQYLEQLNNIRDYSVVQMNRVSENYVFQRHRIRKFSAHQLLKLRETYKFQQKTLNKILENLPDLYLQNCRTGSCQRSDSILFDDAALNGIDAYYKVDFFDTQSHASDYYTPASTLGRSKSSKDKRHSRNSSNTSSDFVEAQPWLKRDSLSVGGTSPSPSYAPTHSRSHNRSFSVATPTYAPDPVKTHKRSLSATHPYHRVAPSPETRGMPTRIMLCEESSDYELATPPTSPSSLPSTPTAGVLQKPPTEESSLPSVHIETCQSSPERQESQSPVEVSLSLEVDSPESTEDELLTALTDDLESNASTPFETSM